MLFSWVLKKKKEKEKEVPQPKHFGDMNITHSFKTDSLWSYQVHKHLMGMEANFDLLFWLCFPPVFLLRSFIVQFELNGFVLFIQGLKLVVLLASSVDEPVCTVSLKDV